MADNRPNVEQVLKPVRLNLGCGFNKAPQDEGWINVDAYASCNPDVQHDLTKIPWPWEDNSIDFIVARHVFEHLQNWWEGFCECARILKPMGILEVRVPDASSDTAVGYRDHLHIIHPVSFHGTVGARKGVYHNAWFCEQPSVPLKLIFYAQVPFSEYNWMPNFLLRFCAKHMRNFIWEQRFTFEKVFE